MIGPYCIPHSIYLLTLASDRAVLCGNVALSILAFSTKKLYSSFLKRVCFFQKIFLKTFFSEKLLKTFKISSDLSKRTAILKIPSRKNYVLSVGFKMRPLRKSIFLCQDKNQLKFCREPCWNAERSNHSFLSIWWISFFKHLYSLICDNRIYRN